MEDAYAFLNTKDNVGKYNTSLCSKTYVFDGILVYHSSIVYQIILSKYHS